jgi:DNA-binding winged helix-turn-helix (wHTH) protein
LLAAFVNNANQVLTRDRLLDLARNREAGPFDRTIDVQVGRLRRKLEDDPQRPTMIKTVRGSGYILNRTRHSGSHGQVAADCRLIHASPAPADHDLAAPCGKIGGSEIRFNAVAADAPGGRSVPWPLAW